MKTLIIAHEDEPLNGIALASWLRSFSELTGVISIIEPRQRLIKRVRREIGRIGYLRFLDVLAFRFYYKFFLSTEDQAWEAAEIYRITQLHGELDPGVRVLRTSSPNSIEAEKFLQGAAPDLVIARCKSILAERIFTVPRIGTFVMHPGVCPEYRNAHGCFWALANGDIERVGMTLIRIDKGVDTGPVYGYFSYPYDEVTESHIVIQHRVVFDNLDEIRQKLEEIASGKAVPMDTTGRDSRAWGQPWLTKYCAWKLRAKRRRSSAKL